MAAITISVQSLLNTAVYNTYNVDTTNTVTQVKTAINSTESWDSSWYQLVFNNSVLSNTSATLTSYGINSNVTLRTANVIDRLATKELKQKAKLNLSELDRTAAGNLRSTYEITELPTQYSGDTIIDNPQPGGLIEGRPWIVSLVVAPTTIEAAVPSNTLLELESWYDASSGTSFTPAYPADGATFTQWADKSAFAHNANPHGGATTRPTVQTNELNAYPVVRFDGVNDGLTINPYTGLVNAAAVTVFAVAKLTATAGYPKLFGQAQSFDMFYSTDTNSWRFNINGQSATSTGANDNAWHIHTVAFDGSQGTDATKFRYRRDKTANTLSFSGTVPAQIGSTSQLDLGFYDLGTAQFMQGDLAEFLIFTKVLTDNEIANVENYLSNKWGL